MTCGSLQEAMSSVSPATTTSTTSSTLTSTTFLIGGAQLYTLALEQNLVDRVLLTRIVSPSFDECDVSLVDFTQDRVWVRRPHAELQTFVGFEVQEGEVEEKGVRYRFEMWERVEVESSSS